MRLRTGRITRVGTLMAVLATSAMGIVGGGTAHAVEGSWAATGSLNQPRVSQQSTLLANGMVLVTGGRNATVTLTSAELYDPRTEMFVLIGPMRQGRWEHTATLLPNGKVLLAGGFGNYIPGSNAQPVLNSAELYDPATGTWTLTPPMQTSRALHSAALLPNGKVLVAGGRTCGAPPPAACDFTVRTNTAELYDPATNTWAQTGNMNKPRHTTSAATLQNGKVLVPGGFSSLADPHDTDNTADLYDPATGTWSLTGNLNVRRARQGAMLLRDGSVLVGPGSRATICGPPVCENGGPPFSAVIVDTSELFRPATLSWQYTVGKPLVPGRFNFQQAVLPNGKALMAGGFGGPAGSEAAQRSSEVYDPATGTWSSAGDTTHLHSNSSSLGNTREAVVLSASPTSFVFDPRVCGRNCGKVLVVGDNLTDGVADLYTPAAVSLATCSSTVSGQVSGNVNVPAGSVTCVTAAQVTGSVIVASGGGVVLTNADIRGNVQIDGAAGVRMCGARVVGATSITHTFGPVMVGDAGDDGPPGCAMNRFSGPVTLDANQSVEVGGNQFAKSLSVTFTSGPAPSAEDAVSEIEANAVITTLSCANNVPAPINDGRPNQVYGSRSGQCSAPGF